MSQATNVFLISVTFFLLQACTVGVGGKKSPNEANNSATKTTVKNPVPTPAPAIEIEQKTAAATIAKSECLETKDSDSKDHQIHAEEAGCFLKQTVLDASNPELNAYVKNLRKAGYKTAEKIKLIKKDAYSCIADEDLSPLADRSAEFCNYIFEFQVSFTHKETADKKLKVTVKVDNQIKNANLKKTESAQKPARFSRKTEITDIVAIDSEIE